MTELTTAINEKLGNETANTVCLLAKDAVNIDVTTLSLPQKTGVNLVYFGKSNVLWSIKIENRTNNLLFAKPPT